MLLIKFLVVLLAISAVCCVIAASLIPVSRAKGRRRLAGSLFIGTAFLLGGLLQAVEQRSVFLVVVGLIGGAVLVWIGLRKYRRDPEGRTPSARILYPRLVPRCDIGNKCPQSQ